MTLCVCDTHFIFSKRRPEKRWSKRAKISMKLLVKTRPDVFFFIKVFFWKHLKKNKVSFDVCFVVLLFCEIAVRLFECGSSSFQRDIDLVVVVKLTLWAAATQQQMPMIIPGNINGVWQKHRQNQTKKCRRKKSIDWLLVDEFFFWNLKLDGWMDGDPVWFN